MRWRRSGVLRGLTGVRDLPDGDRTARGGDISASAAVCGRGGSAGAELPNPPEEVGRHVNPTLGTGERGPPSMGARLRPRGFLRVRSGVLACGGECRHGTHTNKTQPHHPCMRKPGQHSRSAPRQHEAYHSVRSGHVGPTLLRLTPPPPDNSKAREQTTTHHHHAAAAAQPPHRLALTRALRGNETQSQTTTRLHARRWGLAKSRVSITAMRAQLRASAAAGSRLPAIQTTPQANTREAHRTRGARVRMHAHNCYTWGAPPTAPRPGTVWVSAMSCVNGLGANQMKSPQP